MIKNKSNPSVEKQIISQIEKNQNKMIDDIRRLVRIKSVETESQADAPFGAGVRKALLEALKIGEMMGFQAVNLDNYIGYVQYGEGDDYVCAIGHLDVVPEGEGWSHPPYGGDLEAGVLYGRGVLDNKGPVLACLYGLYAMKETGCKLKRPVRIIFGCDEESGFLDLAYYLTREKPPVYGFTPDCKYPVVYSERGRAVLQVRKQRMELSPFFAQLKRYFFTDNRAAALGFDQHYEEYGMMEIGNYKLMKEEQGVLFEATFRYPPGISLAEIQKSLLDKGLATTVKVHYEPVIFDKTSPLITTLRHCYEEITGQDGTPVTTTGGTYAKAMPNIVPFGPSFPGQKGIGHNPDEWMTVSDLLINCKIYGLGLYRLSML